MALIRCPDCNAEVSDKAAACVRCGCPLSAPSHASNKPRYTPSGSVGECPACRSLDTFDVVAEERKRGGFMGALGARFGSRIGGNGRCRCRDCNHTWEFGANM